MSETDDVMLTAKQVQARYGNISAMTLSRWVKDDRLQFPRPLYIHSRRYWNLGELIAWEKRRARRAA